MWIQMNRLHTDNTCSLIPWTLQSFNLLKIAVDYLYFSTTTGTFLAVIEEPGLRQWSIRVSLQFFLTITLYHLQTSSLACIAIFLHQETFPICIKYHDYSYHVTNKRQNFKLLLMIIQLLHQINSVCISTILQAEHLKVYGFLQWSNWVYGTLGLLINW